MTMRNDGPVFYDCEATCLGGLPIEIGWAFANASTGEIQSESHRIHRSERSIKRRIAKSCWMRWCNQRCKAFTNLLINTTPA